MIDDSMKEKVKGVERDYISKVDFLEGEYAVILDDEEPAILIDDSEILAENQDKIENRCYFW